MFIKHENKLYPKFQSEGNASQFAISFAKHFCKGFGLDIGCNRLDWAMPGAIPIDPIIDPSHDAMRLPHADLDFIYSSHCLEHLDSWVEAVEYWTKLLKQGGCLFLYLPDYSQTYWRPWNNRKHKHIIEKNHLYDLLTKLGYSTVIQSGVDLNNSYTTIAIK
jgi:predicted SAM-dependent methyltransferase